VSSNLGNYQNPLYRGYVLGVFVLAYSFNFVDRYILIILQEPIKAEFALSDTQLGLLTGFAFAMFYVVCGIPIARMADRGNRRTIISVAIATWSLMTAVSGFVTNYGQLLAARVGVAVGEAGGSPPAHSIISDIFPRRSRATALAIYSLGINIGILFGYVLGGWINEYLGWRMAFIAIGLPGIAVAILVRTTIAEPPRGFAEGVQEVGDVPGLMETFRFLWSRRSFRLLALATGVHNLAGYGIDAWVPPYIIRTFDMGTAELGTWMGLMAGFLGGTGTLLGGWLCDRLGRRDVRWYMWVPTIAILLTMPAMVATFLVPNQYAALILYGLPTLLMAIYLAPCIAMAHGMVSLRMRALASAILFFALNLIGLGLGPVSIGIVSDLLQPNYGDGALRIALVSGSVVFSLGAAALFFSAAKYLKEDLESAPV
jgi:MFS family permease